MNGHSQIFSNIHIIHIKITGSWTSRRGVVLQTGICSTQDSVYVFLKKNGGINGV